MFLGFTYRGVGGRYWRIWSYWNCNIPLSGRLYLEGSNGEKRGDNQKEKFFASDSVEALILFNEELWGLLRN